MFENVKMSFRLIKKANKLVLWDFLRLAKKSRLGESFVKESRLQDTHDSKTLKFDYHFARPMVFKDHLPPLAMQLRE